MANTGVHNRGILAKTTVFFRIKGSHNVEVL